VSRDGNRAATANQANDQVGKAQAINDAKRLTRSVEENRRRPMTIDR
jgi:hypothetical protein